MKKKDTELVFLDSLLHKKKIFNLPKNKDLPISIYACGITPYSDAHIGHARSYVIFDLLSNLFISLGYKVNLVRNITDIDDKIINEAEKSKVNWFELSDFYAEKTRKLMLETGLSIPFEPKASDYLSDIFQLIKKLIDLNIAYISNGDVLYRVKSYKGSLLINHKQGFLKSENGLARVDYSHKEDARDFVLWKSMPENEVGFNSIWGWGRPGWHIECSAMIGSIFNGHVDIHGGGMDLKFPHHQAEIMQSEQIWGKPLAKIWMHNGSVLSNGIKMSKSLGNYITWYDALIITEKIQLGYGGDILKLSLLGTLWQKPLDWSDSILDEGFELFKLISLGFDKEIIRDEINHAKKIVIEILSDNLNTPKLFSLLKSKKNSSDFNSLAQAIGEVLKLKVNKNVINDESDLSTEVLNLIKRREDARKEKNWILSDKLRNELLELGIIQKDKTI